MSNLYGYGPVTEPMTAQMPLNPTDHKGALRARMWEEARAAHEAGRIRATEARASDYIGPTLPVASGLLARYAQATLVGKPASVFADPDVPHAWTAIDDVARTLVMLGRDRGKLLDARRDLVLDPELLHLGAKLRQHRIEGGIVAVQHIQALGAVGSHCAHSPEAQL